MKKVTQLLLFQNKVPKFFGGKLLKGNAKIKRPLSTKHALHLVLKSERAMGQNSMLQRRNARPIEQILRVQGQKCGVKIDRFVNVGNHLHLVIRITNRELYKKYIRAVTGLIARHVLRKQRGVADARLKSSQKFWAARPFTRLIQWGKDFKRVSQYLNKNRNQALFVAWGFDLLDAQDIYFLNTG